MAKLHLTGDVIERQSYLNGTRYFLIEAIESNPRVEAGGPWTCTMAITLPKEAGEPVTEGDFSLQRDGEMWYGDVAGGAFSELIDDETEALIVTADVDVEARADAVDILPWKRASIRLVLAIDSVEVRVEPSS